MAPAWIVSTLQEIAVGLISVWMTTFVADFTDAIEIKNLFPEPSADTVRRRRAYKRKRKARRNAEGIA